MELRPWTPADREACLAVFDTNAPDYFHLQERAPFAAFLDHPSGSYFVADHEGMIAACGGFALESPDVARLTWLMVRRDLQKSGVGRLLVFTAMKKLSAEAGPAMLRLHTTLAAAGFFEKLGFRSVETIPDGIAPGMDRVEMVKKLKVCP